jgi:hypothetical protein
MIMGTRSVIGVMHGDVCKSVYCHWDGYLDHNGRILLEHYDSVKANYLVALGDISSLGKNIGEKHPFNQFEISKEDPEYQAKMSLLSRSETEGWTTFYERDRGESGTEYAVTHDFVSFLERVDACGAEYYYIMRDGVWYCGDAYDHSPISGKLVPLAEALADQDIETAEEEAD